MNTTHTQPTDRHQTAAKSGEGKGKGEKEKANKTHRHHQQKLAKRAAGCTSVALHLPGALKCECVCASVVLTHSLLVSKAPTHSASNTALENEPSFPAAAARTQHDLMLQLFTTTKTSPKSMKTLLRNPTASAKNEKRSRCQRASKMKK